MIERGKVPFKLTYERVLALNDVLHVLNIWRNLVYIHLLGKEGLRSCLKLKKIFSRGEGYCN